MTTRQLSPAQVRGLLGPVALAAPAYRDLADRIRLQIVDGRLVQGTRLPGERALADALGCSRTTVTTAYTRLAEAGYLQARVGAGNFVTLPRSAGVRPVRAATGLDPVMMTRASITAPDGLGEAFRRAADALPSVLGTDGYFPDGLDVLRESVAGWFERRGLPTDPGQIVVTGGALAAINVVLATLIGPGDRVLLESPTYPGALQAVRRAGARPVGYPLVEDGWSADDLHLTLRQTAPRLAVLIPEHHNPTGLSMGEDTREAVASVLNLNRTITVIDETMVELNLQGQSRPAPLAATMPTAVTVGSTSKAFWGGLRVGWIRAPHDLVPALIETRMGQDMGTAAFEQLVAAELLSEPGAILPGHLERLRHQRDHLIAELARELPGWTVNRPAGGLSLWAQLPGELSTRLAATAEGHGLLLTAGPRFFVGNGGERHLRLPFTADTETLTLAVQRLRRAVEGIPASLYAARTTPAMRLTA